MKACFGGRRNPTKFTINVCRAIGDRENGNGMMIYAETQFMATSRASRVISKVLFIEELFDIEITYLFKFYCKN